MPMVGTGPIGESDWVLMEALPSEVVWPQASWKAEHYRIALTALADLYARWWDCPPCVHSWVRSIPIR